MTDYRVRRKILVDADLSEASFEDAENMMRHDKAKYIICGLESAYAAGRLAQRHDLHVTILPSDVIQEDSWVILGKYMSIYSPGA